MINFRVSRRQGAAVLNEFALVLTLLLIFTMGVVDFTHLFVNTSKIDLLVRQAGRNASILSDVNCRQIWLDNTTNALSAEGYDAAEIIGSYRPEFFTIAATDTLMMTFTLSIPNDLLTSTLSLIGMTSSAPRLRTYSFPVEHPDVCRDPFAP